jgi:hypothetical protein
VGAGAKASIVADLIAFSRSKGAYGGLNLGSSRHPTTGTRPVTARRCYRPDILLRMNVHEKGADKLVPDITKAAGSK